MKFEKNEKQKNKTDALTVIKKILIGAGVIIVIGCCSYLFLFTLVNII